MNLSQIKKLVVRAAVPLLMVLFATSEAAAQTTVDNFTDNHAQLTAAPTTGSVVAGTGTNIIGGAPTQRDLRVERISGSNSVTAEVTGGLFTFTTGATTAGEALLVWDGNDGDANTIAPTGLGGVSLSGTAFLVTINSATAGTTLILDVSTNGSNSSLYTLLLPAISTPTTYAIPFASFQAHQGTGATFTNVGAIALTVRGSNSASVVIDQIITGAAAAAGPVAKKADALAVDVDNDTRVDIGDTIEYTITITTPPGAAAGTGVAITDTLGTGLTLVPGSIKTTPLAFDDYHFAAGAITVAAPGVLANDIDPDGDTKTVVGGGTPRTTSRGGSVTLNTDGSFTFTPAGDGTIDTFTYEVTDPGGNTSTAVVTVGFLFNVAPTLTAGATLSYTENQAATAIDTTITVTDPDSANLASATAQITGNYVNGQDVLSFATIGAISGSFNATTGTLTLSGTDTPANYQAALRTVKYANTSDNPSTSARTVTWIGNDGLATGTGVTSTINVTAVNDAPTLVAGGTLAYTENGAAAAVDAALTVTDADSTSITGATVQITANYVNGQDVLSFTNTANITGTFTAATGTMALSGTDTVANYQAALQAVKYNNTSENPSTSARTVTWIATDGTTPSTGVTSTINVTAVNDAPVLTAGATLGYTENGVAAAIDNTVTVADVDSTNLTGATAQITANFVTGQDVLSFATIGAISGAFNATNGTLTLTGTDTLANYQAALRTVKYANTSENPSTSARTVTWIGNDGSGANNLSTGVTSTINVTAVNDAPTLVAGGTLAYTENGSATAIDATLTVAEPDSANITGATAQITTNYQNGQDILSFATIGAISGSFNATTGTMTLSGTDTVANYQAALRTVKYNNTSESPNTSARTVTWVATDGTTPSTSATSTITVAAVNDAPAVTAGGTLAYTENGAAAVIDTSVTVDDVDSPNLTGATVQVIVNFQSGDVLSFATLGPISGSYSAGTLTLTGSDTIANYQAALRTVKYSSTSENPSTLDRLVQWRVNDGALQSLNGVTSTINVTAVNDIPTMTAGGTLSYTENQAATAIDASLTVTDPDSTITGATAQITSNYVNGQDVLSFATLGSISGSFNTTTGTMTLSGTDTVANYQAALRAVKYNNTSESPTTSARTVTWIATDGTASSTGVTSTINVTAVNDAPVLSAGNTLAYTENDTATAIDTTIIVSDVDSANLTGATVQITANYVNGQDVLSFTTIGAISGTFAAGTGTLTLSGSGTQSAYQTALRAVKYNNTSENPSTSTRTVTWIGNDGAGANNLSTGVTSNISVTAVNDPPTMSAGGTLNYNENQAATAIDTGLTLADPDSTITGATAQIITNYQNGQDVLSFATIGAISGSFNATNGTMTLTGTDTVANYQAALRTVKYNNTSENPSTSARTVTWVATDGTASNTGVTSTINVTAVNDAPVLTAGATLAYTENDAATVIDSTITVSDFDSTSLTGATVQITGNYANPQDVLSFVTIGSISGTFDVPTGKLTLTGAGTLADYQAALRSVKYANTSENPSTAARTITWIGNDGAGANNLSTGVTSTITVTAVNDAPTVTAGGTLGYTENDPATVINGSITVADVDSANLTGATVVFTSGYQNGQDTLSYVTALGITGSFNATSGTLTLSGTTTVANYQTALRNVKYANSSDDPVAGSRTVSWQVNDGQSLNNLSNSPTSQIMVTAVNDPPVAAAFSGLPAQAGIPITYPAGKLSGTDAEAGTTITIDTTATSVTNGTVVINSNGSFVFTPLPSAASGTASFQYRVSDNGNPGPGVNGSYVTVSFTVAGPAIYFVKSTAVGLGNCTLGAECTLATAVTNIGANTSRHIFISDANNHNTTVPLNSGGSLIGQGVSTAFDTLFSISAPAQGTLATRPSVNTTRPTVQSTVTLNTNSTVRGLNIVSTTVTGLADAASAITGVTVNEVAVTTTTATAVNLSSITGTLTFTGVSGAAGVITTTGTGVAVSSMTSGTLTVTGLTTTGGAGANLTNNAGATLNFSAVSVSSGANAAFTATGGGPAATTGGTLNITGSTNTLTSTTGTALNVLNTTIGASDLTFRSITAGTASNSAGVGISLDNTGSLGGLHVTGLDSADAGTNPDAGSGGTIQHKTGTDGSTTGGIGIYLSNTADVQLAGMQLNDFSNYAIRGKEVTGFRLTDSKITGLNGDNVMTPYNDGSISFIGTATTGFGLSGSVAILDNEITGGRQRNVSIDNATGTMNLNFLRNNVHDTQPSPNGDDGFAIEVDTTAVMFADISNNTFTAHGGDHFNLSLINSANADLTFKNNDMQGGFTSALGQGVFILGASYNGTFKYDISNNGTDADPFTGNVQGGAIFVNKGSGTGTFSGQITNNVIGVAATTKSGSEQAVGIHASARGAGGSHTTLIHNNKVRQYFDRGIVLEAGEGSPTLVATVTSNTVSNFADATNSLHGIHFDFGILGADNAQITLDVRNNLIATAGNEAQGGVDFRMRTAGSNDTFIAGYSGGNSSANAQTFIDGQNADGTTFSVSQAASGTYNNGPSSPLPTPNLPTLPPAPLLAAPDDLGDPADRPADGHSEITQAELDSVVEAAIARWAATGLATDQVSALRHITFQIADLPDASLASFFGGSVTIDADGAGRGWFIDRTPLDDAEFASAWQSENAADLDGTPAGRYDLLSAVTHELGHVLGQVDAHAEHDRDNVMYGYLTKGERRVPAPGQARGLTKPPSQP